MKKILLLLTVVLALSCTSDDQPENTAMDLVTGITLRQNFDDAPLQLGNPNALTGNQFVIYPNPAISTVVISAQQTITDVWVVKGKAKKIYQNTNFNTVLNSNLYTEQSLAAHSSSTLNAQTTSTINLNLDNLQKGYYKVFVKIDGVIYWDNLYKYDSGQDGEQQFNALTDFWD